MALTFDTTTPGFAGMSKALGVGVGASDRAERLAGASRAEQATTGWNEAWAGQLEGAASVDSPLPQTPSLMRSAASPASRAFPTRDDDAQEMVRQTVAARNAYSQNAQAVQAQKQQDWDAEQAGDILAFDPTTEGSAVQQVVAAQQRVRIFTPSTVMFAALSQLSLLSQPTPSSAQADAQAMTPNPVIAQKARDTYMSVLNVNDPMAQALAAINKARAMNPVDPLTPQELEEMGLAVA